MSLFCTGILSASGRLYWQWRYLIGSDLSHSIVGLRTINKCVPTKPGPFFSALTRLSIRSTGIHKLGHDAVRHFAAWTTRMQLLQSVNSRTLLQALLFSSAVGLQRLFCSGPARVLCRGRVGVTSSSKLLPVQRIQDKHLQFNWCKLWEMLSPDLLLLMLAVLVINLILRRAWSSV